MEKQIRVLVVDDHEVVREGMRLLLGEIAEIELVGLAASAAEALRQVDVLAPDVLLVDLVLPDKDGIMLTTEVRQKRPEIQVIILTGSFGDDLRVEEALRAGAIGYLLKDILKDELIHAIKRGAQGKVTLHPEAQEQLLKTTMKAPDLHSSLTPRELDVLKLIGSGLSNKKIAQKLELSEGTVKGYVSIVLDKLRLADRTQAALYAHKQGLAESPN